MKCIGGIINVKGDVKTMVIEMSPGKSLSIMLHGPSQDADPWHCMRCWENAKKLKCKDTDPVPFDKVSIPEQALRLGVDPNFDEVAVKTLKTRYKNYAAALSSSIGDAALAKSILSHTPRPFPTPKPMNDDARLMLKCAGRRFEIAQLCVNVKTCSCCGCTRPYDDDPWKKKKKLRDKVWRVLIFDNNFTMRTSTFYDVLE